MLLFRDGFSTADKVTALSGSGIGLNAIRTQARSLGGELVMKQLPAGGLRLELRVIQQKLREAA